MSDYLGYLLTLYKEKKIDKESVSFLIREYKNERHAFFREEQNYSKKLAIIGFSCRMPNANSKEEFWECLRNGVDSIREFPKTRRKDIDKISNSISPDLFEGKDWYWNGGFLQNVDHFDNGFFNILPSDAKVMDPQQRIFLELAHETFETAGYSSQALRGSNTAVFLGDVINEYGRLIKNITASAVIGNISPFITSRVSYFYNLKGPTVNVSTTCSSSLVAFHLACQSLIQEECDMALAGAVNLCLFPLDLKDDPVKSLGILSPEGACRTFDSKANGIARGEGGVTILLKRYEDAIRDKDYIFATVLGSSVNNDGRSSNVGFPNPLAHTELFKKVWIKSGIDPRTISYFEAHGTGTKIGDPIEIQGISKAFEYFTQDKQFCALGSVKSNIGHLTGGGAGLAGVAKVLLALYNKEIPPTLHFDEPNEHINFTNTPLFVNDKLSTWETNNLPRRACINAFGFNGTNSHVLLEEYTNTEFTKVDDSPCLFVFSSKTSELLSQLLKKFHKYFIDNPFLNLKNVSFTLAIGRDHLSVKIAIIAKNISELTQIIQTLLKEGNVSGGIYSCSASSELELVAEKYLNDSPVNWGGLFDKYECRRIPLPTTVFEKIRFWPDKYPSFSMFNVRGEIDDTKTSDENKSYLERILEIFSEVLGIKVKQFDNFFDMGGDSLLAIELINGIHKGFSKKISYEDLFTNPTPEKLILLLEKKLEKIYQNIKKVEHKDSYPVSFGQRRLWILDQIQESGNAYNIYDVYQINGDFDQLVFQQALSQLVNRHSALRTCFFEIKGEISQKVLSDVDLTAIFTNLEGIDDAENKALKMIDQLKQNSFDLTNPPLVKVYLIKISHTKHLLLFMIHHIICDGWSLKILINDLMEFYNTSRSKTNVYKSELPIEYIDYTIWQKEQLLSKKFKELENYWLNTLIGSLPITEIPGDKSRPLIFNFKGAREIFEIPQHITQQLIVLSQKQNSTLYMTLLSAVYVLLYHYSGQRDMIIGSPVSGRTHNELKELVGFFVNTIAIRVKFDPENNFLELLNIVKSIVLGALEKQEYPFDFLVDSLKLERDTSKSPIFNVNVALQTQEENLFNNKLQIERINLEHRTCKWDLEFEFIKKDENTLVCFLEYYTEIYSYDMIRTLIDNFLAILDTITKDSTQKIYSFPLVRISNLINGLPTSIVKAENIVNLFEKQVKLNPFAYAIKCENKSITYQELNFRSNQLANFLKHNLKVPEQAKIGILMDNSLESIIAILSILKANGIFVPLDTKTPLARLQEIVKNAQIRIILSKVKHSNILSRLMWMCDSIKEVIYSDTFDISKEIEYPDSSLMNESLWDLVAKESDDLISQSGWVSSITGLPFSALEMEEYQTNTLNKLSKYLSQKTRVLEVGCGSGLSLFKIAPKVAFYLATDLSKETLKKLKLRSKKENLRNIQTLHAAAHEITKTKDKNFNLVIFNSVIHCFPGYRYLKKVIREIIELMQEEGVIFLGDVMDLEKKQELEDYISSAANSETTELLRLKTDWSKELFVSRDFINDLVHDFPEIEKIEFSNKQHTIKNELTLFRYDTLLFINKKKHLANSLTKKKYEFDLSNLNDQPKKNLSLPFSSESLCYILYTSGSTGIPKGVMIKHTNLLNYITWAIDYYSSISKDLSFAYYSRLCFDLTITSIFCPLLSGSFLRVFEGEFDEVLESMKTINDFSAIKLTPTHLQIILKSDTKLYSVRKLIIGGEALGNEIVDTLFTKYGNEIEVYNEYGPTETTVGCIVFKVDPYYLHKDQVVPIGRPISNNTIHILNDYQQPVPIGAIGEIFVSGASVSSGYLNSSVLNKEKFLDDPFCSGQIMYKTGDLGKIVPNGQIIYMDRKDRQVKIKGHRIELSDIENCLRSFSGINNVALDIKHGLNNDKIIVAYYSSKLQINQDHIILYIRDRLPDYMVPSYFMCLENIPVNSNGKVDYSSLPNPTHKVSELIILPKNDLELDLFEIWGRILNVSKENLSTEDDFFSLGGDSIIAMHILSEIKNKGFTFSLRDIFQNRTIVSLSKKCRLLTPEFKNELILTEAPLAPIQEWFFKQNFAYPAYFNMVYLFNLAPNIDIPLLEASIKKCIVNHEMLRVYFQKVGNFMIQKVNFSENINFTIKEIDLSSLPADEQKTEILKLTAEIQNTFNIKETFLFKAVIFRLETNKMQLFLVAHHLIIDGVSWRILIEDIKRFYHDQNYAPLSGSYLAWSNFLKEKVDYTNLDITYWKNIDLSSVETLFNMTRKGGYHEQQITFNQDETDKLLSKLPELFNASLNEILLGVFATTVSEFSNKFLFFVSSEGHGRDCFENTNWLRTIGWFTTLYPLLINVKKGLKETINAIKIDFEQLSDKTLNYAIGKYYLKDPKLNDIQSQVLFNYFGRVTENQISSDSGDILKNCEQLVAHTSHPKNHLPHLLEVNAIIIDNSLRFSILTDNIAISVPQAKRLCRVFKDKIHLLIV